MKQVLIAALFFLSVISLAFAQQQRPGVAVADLNDDGKLDVVRVNSDNTISILLNNGDNTFNEAYRYPSAGEVIIADVNKDGNLDIINGNQLLLGNGTGAFFAPQTAFSGPGSAMAVADINNDGKLDILAFNMIDLQSGDQVLVALGDGTGNFAPPIPSPAFGTRTSTAVLVADINGDGNLDVVLDSCYTFCSAYVLLGDGTGHLVTPQLIGSGPLTSIADINGDGKLDVFSGGTFFAGNADGTFTQISTPGGGCPDQPYGPACGLADFNGDGNLDLLVNCSSGWLCVELGDRLGNFGAPVAFPGAGSFPGSGSAVPQPGVTIMDFNADAKPDLVLLNKDGSVSFLANPGSWPPVTTNLRSATALASSANPANSGQTVTITATVTAAPGTVGVGTPTGTVNFGALGTATLDAQGKASVSTSTLALGNTTISAQYGGDATYFASNAQLVQQVLSPFLVGSTTTVSSTMASAQVGQTVTFSAVVAPASGTGTAGGNVVFNDGSAALGMLALNSSGVAVLSTKSLAAGSHSITGAYAGDKNFSPSTSEAVTVNVSAPDFSLTATPSSATLRAGLSAQFTVTIAPTGGFKGLVSFACSGLPSLTTCTFNPATVTQSGNAATTSLTIKTSGPNAALTPPTTFFRTTLVYALLPFVLIGVVVLPLRSDDRRTVWSVSVMLLIPALTLVLSGCGCGSNSPQNQTPPSTTPSGTYTVTVAATSGGITHTIPLSMTVNP